MSEEEDISLNVVKYSGEIHIRRDPKRASRIIIQPEIQRKETVLHIKGLCVRKASKTAVWSILVYFAEGIAAYTAIHINKCVPPKDGLQWSIYS